MYLRNLIVNNQIENYYEDDLLDKLSNKENKVELEISTKLKPNFKTLTRNEKILGLFEGAIYVPKEDKIVNGYGQNWLWLCFVTIFVFGYYPKNIYYKVERNLTRDVIN